MALDSGFTDALETAIDNEVSDKLDTFAASIATALNAFHSFYDDEAYAGIANLDAFFTNLAALTLAAPLNTAAVKDEIPAWYTTTGKGLLQGTLEEDAEEIATTGGKYVDATSP